MGDWGGVRVGVGGRRVREGRRLGRRVGGQE